MHRGSPCADGHALVFKLADEPWKTVARTRSATKMARQGQSSARSAAPHHECRHCDGQVDQCEDAKTKEQCVAVKNEELRRVVPSHNEPNEQEGRETRAPCPELDPECMLIPVAHVLKGEQGGGGRGRGGGGGGGGGGRGGGRYDRALCRVSDRSGKPASAEVRRARTCSEEREGGRHSRRPEERRAARGERSAGTTK